MKQMIFWPIFILMLLTSACQVKEGTGSGLVSGHRSSSNVFTISTPTAGNYIAGQTITVQLTFPFIVTVDTTAGTPQLSLTVGSTTRYADYVSGSGTKTLTFTYLVVIADNDSNGITVGSIVLNSGVITFDDNGTVTNCTIAITARTFANVIVDNTAPSISSLIMTNAAGFYHLGNNLGFIMTFSEAVVVTGTPRFALGFTVGGPVYATYSGGTGTTTLSFTYTIQNSVSDYNGYTITSPLELNGGTIKDAATNNSALTFSAVAAMAQSASVDFDGRIPYVRTVTPPANGTYVAAQNLDVTLEFDRNVDITGVPYIELTIGSLTRQATYFSGTGTSTIIFRYTTIPGDVDTNGIAIANSITQNGGNITGTAAPVDSYFTGLVPDQNNVLTIPSTTGVIISAVQPQPITVTRNVDSTSATWGTALDNVWNIGQTLLITVGFNTGMYVDQTLGTPRIPITIGSTTRYATYLSGGNGQTSLVFTYTVVEGDSDTDGSIALSSIDLNGGSITDASNTNTILTLPSAALTTTSVDGIRPTIFSITAPANSTYSMVTGNNNANMDFTVTWTEAVRYSGTGAADAYFPIDIGGTTRNAVWASGSDTTTYIHRPAAFTGLNDSNGIEVNSPFAGAATFTDQAGNTANVFTFTPPVTSSIYIDTTAPTVSSIVPVTADGTYYVGNFLDFTVTFNESVTTVVAGGYPRIPVVIGATTRYLTPTANATSTTHTFRYTVLTGDYDTDGIAVGTTFTNNGFTAYARDIGWNNAIGPVPAPLPAPNINVDAQSATVSTVTPTTGTFSSGDTIDITVVFNRAVTVTGTPRIQSTAQVSNAGTAVYFDYFSGSGTATLVFRYTVTANDFDFDGLTAISAIALNGGTITTTGNTVAATLTFTSTSMAAVYLAYPNTEIWVTSAFTNSAPAATAVAISSTGAGTEACGTSTCRTFDGDDSLSFSAPVNTVNTMFIVFKTGPLTNMDLISGKVALVDDGSAFDIDVAGDININGTALTGGGVYATSNLSVASTNILQVDFSVDQILNGLIVPTTYAGAIGDIIIVTGALSATQKTQIRAYLNTKY